MTRLIRCDNRDRARSIRAKVAVDCIDIGQEQQGIRTKRCCKKRAGHILVHYGLDAHRAAVGPAQRRNAAATCADNNDAGLQQKLDDARIWDFDRFG
jgi:hypothetical protein